MKKINFELYDYYILHSLFGTIFDTFVSKKNITHEILFYNIPVIDVHLWICTDN